MEGEERIIIMAIFNSNFIYIALIETTITKCFKAITKNKKQEEHRNRIVQNFKLKQEK